MSEERPMIHIRLPKSLVKRIDHLGVDWELGRARTVERLLADALASRGERQEALGGADED
ncbi:MAG TPA: hypothetical protein VGA20_04480 [Gemmatimonadales bacterium]